VKQLNLKAITTVLGVREGEGQLFGELLLANMLIGVARNFCWTAGNALFLERFGSAAQPYLFLLSSVMLPALAALYLRLERRLSFRALTTSGFLALFAYLVATRLLLMSTTAGWVTYLAGMSFDVVFFLTNMGFWALAGTLCDVRQAKRLFSLIGSGEWMVMVAGGFATPWIVSKIGTANMFWLAAAGMGGALIVVLKTLNRVGSEDHSVAEPTEAEPQAKPTGSLLMNPFVFFMLLNNALSVVGQNFLDIALYGLLEKRYTDVDQLAGFLGLFWGWIGVVILLSRSFLTNWLLSRYGVKIGLLALPVFVLTGVVSFAVLGSAIGAYSSICFWILAMSRFFDACLRNDLDASAGLLLYQPLPPAQKSLAQATNDGVFVPVATGIAGGVLLLMKNVLGFGPLEIAYTIPAVVIPWILTGFSVTRRYPAMVAAAIAGHRFDAATVSLADNTTIDILKTKLHSAYATEVLYALALLGDADSELPRPELTRLLEHPEAQVRREALRVFARRQMRDMVPAIRERVRTDVSPQVRGEALQTLAQLEEVDALDELTPFLKDTDPELRTAAIVGAMKHGGLDGIVLAAQQFTAMCNSRQPFERRLAARVLGEVGIQSFYRPLVPLLHDERLEVRNEAVIAAGKLKNPRLWPEVLAALDSPVLQSAAVFALVSGGQLVQPLLEVAFEQRSQDPEFQVRVLRVFQQIRGKEVLAFLERQLNVTHPTVFSRVLRALSSCHYRVAPAAVPRIAEKIRAESQHTAWLLAVQASLPDDEALALLINAFEDLRHQDLDRVYLLLSFIYNSQAMFDSRDNLEHQSAERRAYAIEIVDSTVDRDLRPFVLPLLDDLPPADRLQRLKSSAGISAVEKTAIEYVVDIIRDADFRVSDWTRACAIFAAGKLRWGECLDPVTLAVANSRNPLVRQTGLWACSQIDPASYRQQFAQLAANDQSLQQALKILERRDQGDQSMLLDIEKLMILKTVPIFAEAPDYVLAQVIPILEEQEFEPGQRIFEKGDLGTSMYIIVSGKVRVYVDDRELTVLGERKVFGELALLDPEPRSASVTAIEPALLFRISQAAIYELMANHIEIARGIMRVLCRRIRER
jgi:ATP:ADP antiporter, AAA family